MAKTTLYQLLSTDSSPYKIRIVHGIDNDQANVEVCIRVYNKLKDGTQGKTMKFAINFYHTNSIMMINGTRVDIFVSDIYKQLCKILNNHFDELNILNKDLFDKINNTQQSYNQTNHIAHSVNTSTTTIVTNSQIQSIANPSSSTNATISTAISPTSNTFSSNLNQAENKATKKQQQPSATESVQTLKSITSNATSVFDNVNIMQNPDATANRNCTELTDSKQDTPIFCPICNEVAGMDTIECDECQQWLHFKCADVLNPASMENKDFTCTLCIENLMYTANNQHMDSVNEELTHVKQTYDENSYSNTQVEAIQNPYDGLYKSDKENEVEQTLNSIPSRTQNCNINASHSNNQLDRDPENNQISYLEPSVTKPKYKKPSVPRIQKSKENSVDRVYIAQLESEVEKLKSTVELFQKSCNLQTGKTSTSTNSIINSTQTSDQLNHQTNLGDATNVTLNIEQKLVDHRLRTIEMQMSQNMHILQAQQIQLLLQMQAQQTRPCYCHLTNTVSPYSNPGSPGLSELYWPQQRHPYQTAINGLSTGPLPYPQYSRQYIPAMPMAQHIPMRPPPYVPPYVPSHVPPQPPIATTSRPAHPIPQQVQPNSYVHHSTILQQQQNMGESKAYNITAAPQLTPHNPRPQEQPKYNKMNVANGNRVSFGTKSMNQHHKINPQSDLRKADIKTSEQIFTQPEIQSHLENDMDDTETRFTMGTKNMEINNMTVESKPD